MDKRMIEQNIVTKKTDEGFYVEVFNDGKLVWTDTFKTEKELNWFVKCCTPKSKRDTVYLSHDEARKILENNKYGADVFYRHPLGYIFTSIYHLDVFPEANEHGFEVHFINKDDSFDKINVPTIDEAFQVLKDVEDGKI
jgi:hypothetical protein